MKMLRLCDTPDNAISDHDLAELADWASKQKHLSFRQPHVAKCFAMIREGADTLLRERARGPQGTTNLKETSDNVQLPR